jgi:hypothetical protein
VVLVGLAATAVYILAAVLLVWRRFPRGRPLYKTIIPILALLAVTSVLFARANNKLDDADCVAWILLIGIVCSACIPKANDRG